MVGAMPTATWSWKRALLHAGLAFVVVILIGMGAFAALQNPDSNATKFGEGVGRLSVFTAAAVFAASWLDQTGRRRAALALAGGFVLLVGGVFAAILLLPRSGTYSSRPLAEADRAPLQIVDEAGQRRLRHPTLGFSLLHPGPRFVESPEVVAAMSGGALKGDPATVTYGFQEPDTQSALIVQVMNGMGGTRDKLVSHVDGVQQGLAKSAAASADLRWLGKDVTWDDHRHVGRLSASLSGQVRMRIELDAYSVEPAGRPPFVVNLFLTTREPERFADLLGSFRP
jgi:hypothetical protein